MMNIKVFCDREDGDSILLRKSLTSHHKTPRNIPQALHLL